MEDNTQLGEKDIIINCWFFVKQGGITRYAYAILQEIDRDINFARRIEIVLPVGCNWPHFNNILMTTLPDVKIQYGGFWDLIQARKYVRKRRPKLYVSMAPSLMMYENSITTFHDTIPLKCANKSIRNILSAALHKFILETDKFFGTSFVTVSQEAKKDISKFVNAENIIAVIGNGWEHIKNTVADNSIFEKCLDICKGEYYLAISSIAPHKNFEWIIQNARKNTNVQYVIVGPKRPNLSAVSTDKFKDNILYLGFKSDEVLKALIVNAKALISPSLYEGFGIPPLEALACGTKVIVSDIPVYHEIYGDAVAYLNPHDASLDLDSVDWEKDRSAEIKRVLETYTWENAAKKWIDLMERMSK